MKKKFLILTLLPLIISSVVPVMGQAYNIETDVAVQEESTETKDICYDKLSSGISELIFDENLIITNIEIEEIIKTRESNYVGYVSYEVSQNKGFKSFMSYKSITSKISKQYKLQEDYAYTGDYGIRQVNDRYCVAIGTAFNLEVGTYFDLVLENGTIIQCVLGDVKAEEHTLNDNITTASNGCVSEFIVDLELLDSNIKYHGDISKANEYWSSPVVEIRAYETNIFEE